MTDIHPTAIISPGARIGEGVRIGPYSIVESDCEIGDDCWIDAHVKIARYTSLGPRCRVYLGALVGEEPQDHRFKPGTVAHTVIGSDTTIREYVTIHRSPFEGGITSVGDRTLLMAFVHLGHDVRVGNRVTIANQTGISGHVIIEDGAVLSGYVLIHQFCRIGALAMLGGRTIIRQDVPPSAWSPKTNASADPTPSDFAAPDSTMNSGSPSNMPSKRSFSMDSTPETPSTKLKIQPISSVPKSAISSISSATPNAASCPETPN